MKKYGFECGSNGYENGITKLKEFAKQAKIERVQEPVIRIEEISLEATQVVSFVVGPIETVSRNLSALKDTLYHW